jgi:hypothetical protein
MISLSQYSPSIVRAAEALRSKYQIPNGAIDKAFEKEYNCRVIVSADEFKFPVVHVEFDEERAITFLLEWG